jgi:D-alanyl-lipoteichoic acid acyltransferase DltB (MBOAT superfamily)
MLFNTLTYFWFFCIVFTVYWFFLNKRYKLQNLFLLAASYCFYGWWDARFLILIFISSTADFFIGRAMQNQTITSKRKLLLAICLLFNLGILGFFKYYNFFIESFLAISKSLNVNLSVATLKIILPVGVSFYTFQSLSYTIDVYRNKIKPTKDYISFLAFVAFFPQLVAGPIERATHLLPQFLKERKFNIENVKSGFRFILWGLFKKMVIADRLAYFVDHVYNSSANYSGITLVAVAFMFGFQIYCDFSGYSDIAIGSARLLGFDLMQNFRFPYFSKSLQEFWRRWHISLSTWFRDYVYIPLGGNQVSKKRWIFNILITFTLSGLWHGAAATFVIWGFLHGVFLVVESYIKPERSGKLRNWLGFAATFSFVNLALIFFRSKSLDQSLEIFSRLPDFNWIFLDQLQNAWHTSNQFREFAISIMVGFPIFLITEVLSRKNDFNELIVNLSAIKRWGIYLFFTALILIFGVLDLAPQFIYFQF